MLSFQEWVVFLLGALSALLRKPPVAVILALQKSRC